MPITNNSLRRAIDAVGGQSALARLAGTSRQAVNAWLINGVPVERCNHIENVTKGVLHRKLLRPLDWRIYWPELIATSQPARKRCVSRDEGGV